MDIHSASSLGDVETVKDLLIYGKDLISLKNGEGWTPLMYACYNSHKSVVKCLIEQKAERHDLNRNKQSAFILAAHRNNVEILQMVYVEKYINNLDKFGHSPLYYSVLFGCNKSVKWLLKQKADPTYIVAATGDSLIILALKHGNQNIIKPLLKYGAKTDIINKNGETAVELAIKYGQYNMAVLMEAHKGGNSLRKVLENVSLQKYWPLMEKNDIDLSKFLAMNEDDLQKIGVTLLGPRRKMSLLISEMNLQLIQSISNEIENQ